jgi:hypothetical protein
MLKRLGPALFTGALSSGLPIYFPFPPFPPTLFFPLTRDPSSSSEVLQAAVLSVSPPCFPGGLFFTVVSPSRGPDDRIIVISDAHAAAIQRHASTEDKPSNLYSVHADSTQTLTRIPRLMSRSYPRSRFPLRKRNNMRSVSSSRQQRLPPAFGFQVPTFSKRQQRLSSSSVVSRHSTGRPTFFPRPRPAPYGRHCKRPLARGLGHDYA